MRPILRSLTTLSKQTVHNKALLRENCDLNQAVSEAEKIVGYPTSFLNLRWLLTDELANIALHLRKLLGTNHPLLDTARQLLFGNSKPAWGLVVLLVSRAGGLSSAFSESELDVTAGVLHSQRALAEVTEMIRTSNLIHKSLLNMDEKTKGDLMDLNFGNKISLLSGDYLLSKSYHDLACLRNQSLNELMSSALRDLVDAEFIGPRDEQNLPLPCKPTHFGAVTIVDHFDTTPYTIKESLGNPKTEWLIRNILGGASLLGKSCQGALKLANHTKEIQQLGYLLGKNMALAWQAQLEQEVFKEANSDKFSLISAPVMLHLQRDPELYTVIEKGAGSVNDVDYEYIKKIILSGGALEETKNLQKELSKDALHILMELPPSDARSALENIMITML